MQFKLKYEFALFLLQSCGKDISHVLVYQLHNCVACIFNGQVTLEIHANFY